MDAMNKVEHTAALLIGQQQLEIIKLRAVIEERDAKIAELTDTIKACAPPAEPKPNGEADARH